MTRSRPAQLLAAVLLVACLSGLAAAQGFVEGVEDLPLMAGLAAVPESGVSFDAPEGRIVVAYAEGEVAPEAVLAFYAATLPQLGWHRLGERSFEREKERLNLELTRSDRRLIVRFTLAPKKP
jgi:hypothetical protein